MLQFTKKSSILLQTLVVKAKQLCLSSTVAAKCWFIVTKLQHMFVMALVNSKVRQWHNTEEELDRCCQQVTEGIGTGE